VTQVTAGNLGVVGQKFWALLLEKFAIRVIVLVSNLVLPHHIIVEKL
jgi:hypothetical protein